MPGVGYRFRGSQHIDHHSFGNRVLYAECASSQLVLDPLDPNLMLLLSSSCVSFSENDTCY